MNVDATKNLATQAAHAGVKRFIFISTIGVHGATTAPGEKFSELSSIKPYNNYSLSKWEAEQELLAVASISKMEVTILRPPMVYGGRATGNFGRLLHVLDRNLPLPLASVRNLRSLVGVGNLTDFIVESIHNPAAANQIFTVSDGDDISTVELLEQISKAMGRRLKLFSIPVFILKLASYVIGKPGIYRQLGCNLQVDSLKARVLLGWAPKKSTKHGLQEAAHVFIQNKKS
jgi:nucleoside-diphosphate-sugar epimerase